MRLDSALIDEMDVALTHERCPQKWLAWAHVTHEYESNADHFGGVLSWAWCPTCLVEGHQLTGQDYIRMPWAIACAGYCHTHRIPLVDGCGCGARVMPVHVADGALTRLLCKYCERPVGLPRGDTRTGTGWRSTADLQIEFEIDLVRAINGRRPVHLWCGISSNKQLLAIVRDIAYALCTKPNYAAATPIDAFNITLDKGWRLPSEYGPGVDHKLCRLSAFWRRRVVGAVLAVIGNEEVCAVMSTGLQETDRSWAKSHWAWRGSLEWLIECLPTYLIERLTAGSTDWPPDVRDRWAAALPSF